MAILLSIILIVLYIALIVFNVQFLIVAFKNHVLWGLGSIFVPFVSLVFLIMFWNDAKSPFLKSLATAVIIFFVAIGAGAVAAPQMQQSIQQTY